MHNRPVGNLISHRQLIATGSTTSVLDAARTMAASHVGSMLVIDDDKLVGIFTERDLLVRVIAAGLTPAETRLSEVMTRDPIVIARDQPLSDAIRLMDENGFRHLPVIDADGILGVIAQRDLPVAELAAMRTELEARHELAERMW